LATKAALRLADYTVTEAGFGADLGAEKFLDIKTPNLPTAPSAVVIVATLRALKMNGGVAKDALTEENVEAVRAGFANLKRHVENIRKFGIPAVVAINEFISKIVVHERDVKRAKYAVQRIEVYFNYIGKFENELTKEIEPTEQEMIQMREEIEEAKKEKSRAYHRAYSKEYRAKNLEREYERIKAREYRARKKLQAIT